VAIVVDFGFYIPKQLFQADKPVMVNIHPSLLPNTGDLIPYEELFAAANLRRA